MAEKDKYIIKVEGKLVEVPVCWAAPLWQVWQCWCAWPADSSARRNQRQTHNNSIKNRRYRKGASDLLFLSYDPEHGGGSQIQFSQQTLTNLCVSLAFHKTRFFQNLRIPHRAGFPNVHRKSNVVIFLL